MILLVAFHPRARRIQQPRLYQALKEASNWMHYIPGCWLLVTDEDPETWVDRLTPFLGTSSCFVVRITDDYQGLLPDRAWDWLDRHRAEI